MKVYILKHGILRLEQEFMLGKKVNDDEHLNMPILTLLIEHPDGLILVDAGVNIYDPPMILSRFWCAEGDKDGVKQGRYSETREEGLLQRLGQLGHKAEDINHVILTHMHPDHDGYLHYFTNAKIWVSKNEFDMTMRDYGMGKLAFGIERRIEYWAHNPLKWELVEEEIKELVPGVTMYNFGSGHHHGMLCPMIEMEKNGKAFFVSDAICTRENMKPPIVGAGNATDPEGYVENIKKIIKILEKEKAEIWFSHDIEWLEKMKTSTEGYYQ
jgi:glyoxylase-like metal-dependent hydrolase (beta-lactamase superfamily II)